MAETIFYIFGSVFFAVAIIAVCVWLLYWLKILKNLSKISFEVKEKVENLSSFIKIFINLFEKLVNAYKKHGRRKKDKDELG
ncbi:hypothetical protein KJ636_01470 [Patescibacteria group bacterium]|nr:hypothetical protein [bacterium]MBU4298688.1 hypothetical protein [Patescibacteria group bacterium]MBU4481322.1 hypothetical protein [Patescibacteria group bacterium]